MTNARPKSLADLLSNPRAAQECFEALARERTALAAGDVRTITIDVHRAVSTALAVAERVEPLQPALRRLPDFRFELVEDIPRRALALKHAHERLIAASDGDALEALLAEALPLRQKFFDWLPTLVNWSVFTPAQVEAWRAGSGHLDAGADLAGIGGALVAKWKDVEGKVALTRDEAVRGVEVGNGLLKALGNKDARGDVAAAANDRQRAFTLLVDAWRELERGVDFVRFHQGDADDFVPSIFSNGRRTPRTPAKDPAPPAPTPAT